MSTAIRASIAFAVLVGSSGIALSQPPVHVFSVCDILSDPNRFAGKTVAVLGRSESDESGLTCCFVAQDRCERPIKASGHKWPAKIWVKCCDELPPVAQTPTLTLKGNFAREQLERVRQTTTLRVRKKAQLKADGDVVRQIGRMRVKDQWEIAFGRVELRDQLSQRGGRGFGDPPIASVQIVAQNIPCYVADDDVHAGSRRVSKGQR